MDIYKINISDETKEHIKKMQNLSSAISNSTYIESITKTGQMLSNYAKALLDASPDINQINETLQHSLENIAKIMSSYNYTLAFEGMAQMAKELAETLSKMQIEQLKILSQTDFKQLYSHVNYHNKSFDDLIDLAYETTVTETKVSPLTKEDLKATLNTAKENKIRWKDINIQLSNHIDKFKKENYIFYIIIAIFIQCFFVPWFADEVGKPVMSKIACSVKELPEKGAEIICHLEQNIEAIITENQNYYYKVSFIDENGIEREGYVAKRNLKIIDQEETSDEQPTVSGNDSLSLNED